MSAFVDRFQAKRDKVGGERQESLQVIEVRKTYLTHK